MPTYSLLSQSEYLALSESEYLALLEGAAGVHAGYIDTFSLIFGWWSSEPVDYTYYNLGSFYITRSTTNSQYISKSHNKTYYIHPSGPL